jgi:hypothetical protein
VKPKQYVVLVIVFGSALILGISVFLHFFSSTTFYFKNLLHWDAEHYYWIRNNGYEGFRVAFFPLLPYVWKLTNLGALGISILNGILFWIALFFLLKELGTKRWSETLLIITIPSFIFFYLPYTESLFFLASVMMLFGLERDSQKMTLFGLFLSTLARPAFTVFIPAYILTLLFQRITLKEKLIRFVTFAATSLAALLVVAWIQYLSTGKWFEFFSVQQGWGNKLQVPQFPLRSWAGGFIVRLDGAALVVGIAAGITFIVLTAKQIKNKTQELPPMLLFSLAYLAGISLTVLLFRGGSLFSLNRFVFATPFFIVALVYYLRSNFQISWKKIGIAFISLTVFWLLFESYVHILTMVKFAAVSLLFCLVLLLKHPKNEIHTAAYYLLVGLLFTLQIYLYVRFVTNEWVG